MDRHITSNFQIPAGSFTLFTVLTATIWLAIYNQVVLPLKEKYTGRAGGVSPTLRIGIGLTISCLAMAVAAVVENIRRKTAIQQGLQDDKGIVNMSAMWLIPQFVLIGISKTVAGGRESWLSTNLNKGHYDYNYGLLTFLSLLNFVYFVVCCHAYGSCDSANATVSNEREDLKEGLLSKCRDLPSTSSA
ncbi:NRT1/ PTR FAMILY 1.1 [Thalictrum thalictroides]|uniref:NRT1/ PTR FAMILY 1.1 n=1 Tax=Thalictrum thalictroides TaxID=46969 RepID=A0A7J6X8V5_THATH|nr:NRT1/ PTR FAMILY 1.1 [Thalictrum thalictroides]